MPAKVRKNKRGGYTVSTPHGVHAKNTTLAKAKAQQRLLNAIDHGFVPRKKKKKKRRSGLGSGQYDELHGEFCMSRARTNGVEMP